jgi:hypothetical protein
VVAAAVLAQHAQLIPDDQLDTCLALLIPLTQDDHASVRVAAFVTLQYLLQQLEGWLQEHHAAQLFRLFHAASRDACPRVVACGAAALSTYCRDTTVDDMTPYLSTALGILDLLFKHDNVRVQEEAVDTLASVARLAATFLVPHLPGLIEQLLGFVRTYLEPAQQQFRLRALECVTLLLVHVPVAPEVAHGGVKALLDILLPMTGNPSTVAHPPHVHPLAHSRFYAFTLSHFHTFTPHAGTSSCFSHLGAFFISQHTELHVFFSCGCCVGVACSASQWTL